DQILEIAEALSLKPDYDQLFTICTRCNEILREISKAAVKERVPEYVFQTQETFRVCPRCDSIYWSGTHKGEMISFIDRHNLTRRP
ncbi:MAG: hypothetical protein JXB42_05440, partial [Deltaproteobacteria bacterium]|nr:hypothetical protein [Deltaproteobacteria bacterium]